MKLTARQIENLEIIAQDAVNHELLTIARRQACAEYPKKESPSPRYHFSDIPNNDEGRELVRLMRKYLNPKYKMTAKGQYLKDGENWRSHSYGQPLALSKCIRLYLDPK